MIFIYNAWDEFCKKLKKASRISIPIKEISKNGEVFLALKHDIENTVPKAYKLAEIEYKYGHRGTYYVQANLLNNPLSVKLLKEMQDMGHEISYHYDVMDSNHGNIDKAIEEFEFNRKHFEELGFQIITVCQHGNPVVERIGYTSNRDFFRSEKVRNLYPEIADIMVNFKEMYHTDYSYFSDAGRHFCMIYDPINNDIIKSDNKNILYENLDKLFSALPSKAIISTHPHRWTKFKSVYIAEEITFIVIKRTAKTMIRVPILKKIMSRYYYLAKKI